MTMGMSNLHLLATVWMNLTSIIWNERGHKPETLLYDSVYIKFQIRQNYVQQVRIPVSFGGAGDWGHRGMVLHEGSL